MWWKVLLVAVGVSVLCWAAVMLTLSLTARRPDNLGVVGGKLSPCPSSPNCVCSMDSGQAAIEPLSFDGDPEDAWKRAKEAVARLPGAVIRKEEGGYLHAECTSFLFRFVDDLELLMDERARVIHVRSASRAGHSDLGVNRARVERARKAFHEGR
jgi:uncharacterized protein (DUF1499 family)